MSPEQKKMLSGEFQVINSTTAHSSKYNKWCTTSITA
jgi:hypothetical protein